MKWNVAVIFGGQSVEHEISILSAQQVMQALDQEKYEVIPVYIAKDGMMYCDESLKVLSNFTDLEEITTKLTAVNVIRKGKVFEISPIKRKFRQKEIVIDVALPVIHGTNGEDGTLQGYLELLGIPYCGCRVLGAAIGQDKVIMKQVMDHHGIPTPAWFYVTAYESIDEETLAHCRELVYPLILKPASLGSSVGIEIVKDEATLLDKLPEVFRYDEKAIIEKLIEPMKEVNCSVLGDLSYAQASQLEEVLKGDEILSYQDKYEGSSKVKGMASASRKLPADLPESMREEVQSLAIKTFHALHASGVCRIDFIIDEGTEKVYVNEINTIPGSLAFYLWEASGVSFTELLDQLIELAFDNVRRRDKRIYSYETNLLASYREGGLKGIKK